MKKLHMIMMALLSTAIIQSMDADQMGRGGEEESIQDKIARQQARTDDQKEAYLRSKLNRGVQLETPEFRLIIKAREYRAEQEDPASDVDEDAFQAIMSNKAKTYQQNLQKNDRDFGENEAYFLDFCRTATAQDLANRIEEMKTSGEQFIN